MAEAFCLICAKVLWWDLSCRTRLGTGWLASQSKTKPLTTMSRDERLFGTNEMTSRYEVMLAVQKCLSSGKKHILLTPSAKIHFL